MPKGGKGKLLTSLPQLELLRSTMLPDTAWISLAYRGALSPKSIGRFQGCWRPLSAILV